MGIIDHRPGLTPACHCLVSSAPRINLPYRSFKRAESVVRSVYQLTLRCQRVSRLDYHTLHMRWFVRRPHRAAAIGCRCTESRHQQCKISNHARRLLSVYMVAFQPPVREVTTLVVLFSERLPASRSAGVLGWERFTFRWGLVDVPARSCSA